MGENAKQATRVTGSRARRMVALVLLTLMAAFAPAIEFPGDGVLLLSGSNYQTALTCVIMIALLYRAFFKVGIRFSVPVLVFAIIFGVLTGMGMQLNSANQGFVLTELELECAIPIYSFLLQSRLLIVAFLTGMYVGYSVFFYFVCDFLLALVQKMPSAVGTGEGDIGTVPMSPSEVRLFKWPISYRTCLLVMLIAWLPYIIIFCPTACTADTSRQLAQFFGTNGLYPTTQFPYAVSLLYGGLYSAGCAVDPSGYLGLALIDVVQIALCLLVYAAIVVALKELGAPRMLVKGALLFFALFPLVPVYAVSISKDTLHAIFVALFVVQILIVMVGRRHETCKCDIGTVPMSRGEGHLNVCDVLSSIWMFALVGLLVCITRNNGVILVIVPLIVLAVVLRRVAFVGCALGVVAVFAAIQFALFPAMGVASAGSGEMLSTPVQVIANYVSSENELTEQEALEIEGLFGASVGGISDSYRPRLADDTKALLSAEPVDGDRAARTVKLALRFATKEPLAAVGAFLETTYGTWYPFCYGTYWDECHPNVNMPGDSWANMEWFPSANNLPAVEERNLLPTKALQFLHLCPGLKWLYTPGVYTWLILFLLLCATYFRRQSVLVIVVCLPLLLLLGVMVFAPCSSLRYAMPMVLSLPVLIYLLMGFAGGAETESEGDCKAV